MEQEKGALQEQIAKTMRMFQEQLAQTVKMAAMLQVSLLCMQYKENSVAAIGGFVMFQ